MSKPNELAEQITKLVDTYRLEIYGEGFDHGWGDAINAVLSLIDGSQTYKMTEGEEDTYIDKRVIREAVKALREEEE